MPYFSSGCFICGKPLEYFQQSRQLACVICGDKHDTTATCVDGHYVCDNCHAEGGIVDITALALHTSSKNPMHIATQMMLGEQVNMHGPEHHYLIPAALLSAYHNAGGEIELEKALQKAVKRAQSVPGGVCGMWGSCGAAIGAGIFMSIITGSTPLAEEEWSLSNALTSQCLADISANGGPRCCKRNCYLAISRVVEFTKEHFGIEMENSPNIRCGFYKNNNECKKQDCLYHPVK